MKRKIKSVARFANQLTDAKPEFVSIVGHGANQTPFRTVKAARIIADFSDTETQEERDMAKPKDKAKGNKKKETASEGAQAEIQKVTFEGAQFDSAEAVQAFMEGKGYSDFTVEKTDTGFEIIAKDAADFEGELSDMPVAEGVTFYVGKLAEGVQKLADETVQKEATQVKKEYSADADESVKRYCDYYNCYIPPQGKTLADVLTEQYESGNFPAYWDLAQAFQAALFNLIKSGEVAQVKTLTAEFGDMITAILAALSAAGVDVTAKAAFLEKTSEKEPEMKKEQKSGDKPEAGAEAAVDAPEKDKVEGEQGGDAAPEAPAKEDTPVEGGEAEGGEAAPEADAPEAGAEPAEKAAPKNELAAAMAEAMSAVVAPLTEALKTLTAQSKETSEGLAELQGQVSKTGERVGELENSRQSRKSADVTGVVLGSRKAAEDTESDEQKRSASDFDERMRRNALGIS